MVACGVAIQFDIHVHSVLPVSLITVLDGEPSHDSKFGEQFFHDCLHLKRGTSVQLAASRARISNCVWPCSNFVQQFQSKTAHCSKSFLAQCILGLFLSCGLPGL